MCTIFTRHNHITDLLSKSSEISISNGESERISINDDIGIISSMAYLETPDSFLDSIL